ncbi:MAG: hypothetical protein ACYDDQ_13730 [Vulcanimicrobiaceae bacterium]
METPHEAFARDEHERNAKHAAAVAYERADPARAAAFEAALKIETERHERVEAEYAAAHEHDPAMPVDSAHDRELDEDFGISARERAYFAHEREKHIIDGALIRVARARGDVIEAPPPRDYPHARELDADDPLRQAHERSSRIPEPEVEALGEAAERADARAVAQERAERDARDIAKVREAARERGERIISAPGYVLGSNRHAEIAALPDDPEREIDGEYGKVLAWSARRVGARVADALTDAAESAGGLLADALGGVASDDPAREITAHTPITAHTSESEIAQIDTARAEADRAEAADAARMRAEILDSYDRDEKAAAAAAERDASLARYDRVDDEHDEPEHEDPARGYSGPERDYSESDALADAQERADTRAVEQECADRIASEAELEAAERDTDDGNAYEREVAEADDRLEARANAEYDAHEAAYRAAAGEDERIEEIADPEIEGPELDDELVPEP